MDIHLLDSASFPGNAKKPNEDLIILENGLFAILDGATGLGRQIINDAESDASWFVKEFSKQVTRYWIEQHDFSNALNLSISELEKLFYEISGDIKIEDYEIPSAGMAAVIVEDGLIAGYRSGDCQVYLSNAQGVNSVFPKSPLEQFDNEIMEVLSGHIRIGASYAQARKKVLPCMRALRASMNCEGGYAVLSPNINCIEHIQHQIIDNTKPGYLLLTTDGFSAVMDKYKRYSIETLFERLNTTGLQEVGQEIRKIENADLNLNKYPRLKISDDASAVLLQVG